MVRRYRARELHQWELPGLVKDIQDMHRTLCHHMHGLDPRCAHYKAIQALNFQLGDALRVIDSSAPFGIEPHSAECHLERPPWT